SFTEKTVIKRLLSVVSMKSVYKRSSPVDKKDGNNDLRNTLLGQLYQPGISGCPGNTCGRFLEVRTK
ncbi:MAG: hypothetical protein WCC12_06345, partial [Anaerolineales bacterium]